MQTTRNIGFTVAVALLGAAGTADAGGLWLPARGVRSLSMGGATVAGAQDGSAMWDNPANLAALDGTRLAVDLGLIHAGFSFTREGSGTAVSNEAAPQVDPALFLTTDFGLRRFTFGVGFWAPYLAPQTFDENAATRYQLVSSTGSTMFYFGLGAAWHPTKWLRIGAVLENLSVKVRKIQAASAYTGIFGQPESPDWDMLVKLEGSRYFNLTAGFGLWARLGTLPIEVGLSTQLPMNLAFQGTMEARLPSSYFFDAANARGDAASFEVSLPWIVRAGMRYDHDGKFDIEAAYKYERWQTLQNIVVSPDISVTGVPGIGEYKIKPLSIPHYFRDAHSVHLGGSVGIGERVRARAGYFFERGAVPAQTMTVDHFDANKHGVAVGATVAVGSWNFDLVYAHVFMQKAVVGDSVMAQQNPVNPNGATIVGNGTYGGDYNIVGFGVSKRF